MLPPKLTHVFDLGVSGPAGFPFVASSHSNTCVAHVDQGTVELPDGTTVFRVVTASDWMTTGPTNTLTIDARASAIGNDERDNIDFAYQGKIEITPKVAALFSGKEEVVSVDWGDCYYYTTPRIFSRSEKWAWVNDKVFVAAAKISKKGDSIAVVYRIYQVG